MSFHEKTAKEVLLELTSTAGGLSSDEAKRRLTIYGPNRVEHGRAPTLLAIFLSQFISPIVWVLLAAIGVSLLVHETADAIVIGAIVILNAILGCVQEYRAEKAIALLKKLTALKARTLRDGKETFIEAEDLVPGDIILLETGDKIPADARIVTLANLQTQEASLTGESTPISKQPLPVDTASGVADRTCLVFAGTIVTSGRATAVVITTGSHTELGKIAKLIQEAKPEATPLQRKLARLSIQLTTIVIVIAAVVFLLGLARGQPTLALLLAAIALAVAAIPEGLPAVVTISLALGIQRMAAKNALIRRLASAETLGSCSVICADKTGTLTKNEMTVRKLYVDNTVVDITGTGYATQGTFSSRPKDLDFLLTIGLLNNNSLIENSQVFGDPTEAALRVSAMKAGLSAAKLLASFPRVGELEFTSERKRMTTFHQGKKLVAFVKGAPDVILGRCTKVLMNGKSVTLTAQERARINETISRFSKQALRVLGFACKDAKKQDPTAETGLTFVGLQAMIDPPRDDVKAAIAECISAGIKVVMITGDHLETAKAVGAEIGLTGRAITGAEIERMEVLPVEEISIYARVDPAHKLRIVQALQSNGHIVAMTGDGINDAPALKKADIGIAMGTGTDVAREASAMVLADDSFPSIVAAVREGRRIFDNMHKFVAYLLSSNLSEILTVFIALLVGWQLPVTAIQLLWINLVTDGFPALALGVEPMEADIMKRKPRAATTGILENEFGRTFLLGAVMAAGALFLFWKTGSQTVAFTTLVVMELLNVFNQRDKHSIFTRKPLNIWIWLAVLGSLGLQLAVLYTPLSSLFGVTPLTATDWLWIGGTSLSILVVGELLKWRRQ